MEKMMAGENKEGLPYNAKLGLVLFVLYLALYGGFMALSVTNPKLMATPAVAGVNLAIIYGFGLIFAALFLACVYMALCKTKKEDGQ
jgi:uncharacterized membrane protein (DUF485 family)